LTGAFEPEDIATVSFAFERVCKALEIGPHAAREREVVAIRLIELARRGERNSERLIEKVLQEAGLDRTS